METRYLDAEEMGLFENGEAINLAVTVTEHEGFDRTAINLAPEAIADLIPVVAIFSPTLNPKN